MLERLGKREGGDTGSTTALCNYCGSCCIVTIFDRLWHRWIWPQTRKLKGWGCSKLTKRRELLRDKERRKMVWTRSISFARMMLKAGRKFTSAGKNILFNILEDHGKKFTSPSWSLGANVITDGICSGWVFLMAHVRCFLIFYPFGHKVGICHCYVYDLPRVAFVSRVHC